jgi:ElaB/YqjD/DUF883 family membrane-anchored ribosome-binding protein
VSTTTHHTENSGSQSGNQNAPLTNRVADSAHDRVDRAAKHAARAEDAIREKAADSSDAVQETVRSAKQDLDEMTGKIERYARANPVTAAGIAFAAGMLLSSMLRR